MLPWRGTGARGVIVGRAHWKVTTAKTACWQNAYSMSRRARRPGGERRGESWATRPLGRIALLATLRRVDEPGVPTISPGSDTVRHKVGRAKDAAKLLGVINLHNFCAFDPTLITHRAGVQYCGRY